MKFYNTNVLTKSYDNKSLRHRHHCKLFEKWDSSDKWLHVHFRLLSLSLFFFWPKCIMYTFLAEVMAGNWNFLLHLVSLDLWPITFTQTKLLLISMFPTKYHDHWILQAEIMAENSHIWPQINDLWTCNLTFDPYYLLKMYVYLFQSFLPNFMTIGHSKLKLWLIDHIFDLSSMTFDL